MVVFMVGYNYSELSNFEIVIMRLGRAASDVFVHVVGTRQLC